MKNILLPIAIITLVLGSCKKQGCIDPDATNYDKNAKKDNGKCQYPSVESTYEVPSTYTFTDANGNSTVSYSGQTDRLSHLESITSYAKSGTANILTAQNLKDMYVNLNGNGNGQFSFSSTKQLKNKCFALDEGLYEQYMDSIAVASQSNGQTASQGQAGILASGTSSYLFAKNGIEYTQLLEKGIMGGVLMYQALNVYFGDDKMNVDNTAAVDPGAGEYYTKMEHHFDEAFGYFGVDIDFPNTIPSEFWGEYCDKQNSTLGSNEIMISNFRKGRAAISNDYLGDRDAAILQIRKTWEEVSAYQAVTYIDQAISFFGNDQAKFLHVLSEAYAFAYNLKYAPLETRRLSNAEHESMMDLFPLDFYAITLPELNDIKSAILAKY
ncbi:MAG: hypothetical protein ACI9XP_000164 [Lentimonas sp.]|jgi:hypothetical protein